MSLLNEFGDEVEEQNRSEVDKFLATLTPEDRTEFHQWLQNPTEKAAMYRVLKRRGLKAASRTFGEWVCRVTNE